MTRSQAIRGLYVLFTAIIILLITVLIFVISEDWHLWGLGQIVGLVVLFSTFPFSNWLMYRRGILDERNRCRARITNVMESYQVEPHGIKFTQHKREG